MTVVTPTLALVIPVYNEEECVELVIRCWDAELRRACGQDPYVIITVNDGSRDKSAQILDKLAQDLTCLRVIHQPNGGHGSAVRNGYEQAIAMGAEWIAQTDSDDQFFAEDFTNLYELRADADFILGWRQGRDDPQIRKIISKINRFLVCVLIGSNIRDPNVPFRIMRKAFLYGCLARIPRGVFAPNIFLSALGFMSGARVIQQPVQHKERDTGEVSIKRWKLLKVCFRSFCEFVAWRLTSSRDRLFGWYGK